jgi:ribosomal-protein-alanine N-acetyltransferase
LSLQFRRGGPGDLDGILEIERASFPVPWTEAGVVPELEDDGRHLPLVVFSDDEMVAFALIWIVADELHLVNFAVSPSRRREGIGQALLDEVLARARDRGTKIVTLEVRDGNDAARELYRASGFVEVALRPDYYPDTREDAVIMVKMLDGVPGPSG